MKRIFIVSIGLLSVGFMGYLYFSRATDRLKTEVESLELEVQELTSSGNNLFVAFSTGLKFKSDFRQIENFNLRNEIGDELSISSIIKEESMVLYYEITDCRICFDLFISKVKKLKNNQLFILVYAKNKADYIYFQKTYSRQVKHKILMVETEPFGNFFDLGVPLLIEVNPSLEIIDAMYLSAGHPTLMDDYVDSFIKRNSSVE